MELAQFKSAAPSLKVVVMHVSGGEVILRFHATSVRARFIEGFFIFSSFRERSIPIVYSGLFEAHASKKISLDISQAGSA